MKYTSVYITEEEKEELLKDKSWLWICENNYGACYWKKENGELLWVSDESIKYQKLKEK